MPFRSLMCSRRRAEGRLALGGLRALRRCPALLCAALLAAAATAPPASADAPPVEPEAVDFARDVGPILAARCIACHGPHEQESGLRLDRGDNALAGGDDGAVIVPLQSTQSRLIERIAASDAELRMPPEGEPLAADQIALLRRWIDAGAAWPEGLELTDPRSAAGADHWSLAPLVRPQVPGGDAQPGVNPIDAFVAARLAEQGWTFSPEADRRTLLRRATIDLTGLVPTPDETRAFLTDAEPGAYERVVDRLLASPRYGERWARHWMDVVHFAETHGHDQDRPRPNAWPYRDYLIRSFNDDKPYARFVAEQVAGDVLWGDDPQATVALGFLAAGPWDESSLMCIVDDTVDKRLAQVLDRDDMIANVMSTFTSVTVHCARCHHHKFDPISQEEYYALQAVFAGVDRADRPYDPDPALHARRRALDSRQRALATCDGSVLTADPQLAAQCASLEARLEAARRQWVVVAPSAIATKGESTAAQQVDGSLLFGGPRPEKDEYILALDGPFDGITALRLEVLPDPSLPEGGPGRHDNGNFHLTGLRLRVVERDQSPGGPPVIAAAYSDFDQSDWPIAAAADQRPETGWGIHPQVGKPHTAVFVFAEPLVIETDQRLEVTLEQAHGRGHVIGRLRLALAAAEGSLLRPFPETLEAILAKSPVERSADEAIELARALLLAGVDAQRLELPPPSWVYAAASEFKGGNNFRPAEKPRPVHVLRRGDVRQPLDEAAPGALACVGLEAKFDLPDPDDEGARRAALARWLVDPGNVLTWRSIVNRVWHFHFERGIVDTPNDLGRMGGPPSHPELLDWLAVEFRDGGGSLKKLHRLIATSRTYRQSAAIDPARAALDGDNRLLWRMNRRRLDAECIRDAVLQTSGKLDLAMGGPSVKQFVESPGIHVTPHVDYQAHDVDYPGNCRRAVYRFLFRTLPDPLMEALDCPDGSQLTAVRSSSLTALQALALLDNRFIVRQSEHAAARLASEEPTTGGQIARLFQLALARDPQPDERARWEAYAERHGLANACRMMFNLNEFVFVD